MMKMILATITTIAVAGCFEIGHQPSDARRAPRWEPTPIEIDCGPSPIAPAWSARVDDSAGMAIIPINQWMDLATWIAAVEDWQSCYALRK